MVTIVNLKVGESLGDRFMKVDHAGEHGAICVYTAQLLLARWRAPNMVEELMHFRTHERGHRALFASQLETRGLRRCRSYHFCAIGGYALGLITGLLGRGAIAATTIAIERVVLRHLNEQISALGPNDQSAVDTINCIIADEQEHHDQSASHLPANSWWSYTIGPVVSASTEVVIWLGMRL
nr:demethoxyubiquinone hydroxylase family protein [uncultured Sphingomonas sp.]